jgi:hypothetical protein
MREEELLINGFDAGLDVSSFIALDDWESLFFLF